MDAVLSLLEKVVPTITVVGGGIWALYLHIAHRREVEAERKLAEAQAEKTRKIEVQRPFLEIQLKLFLEAATVVGRLISLPSGNDWNRAEERFWALYWSELGIVEDESVEQAMIDVGHCLTARKQSASDENVVLLKQSAYAFSRTIRESIENSWGRQSAGLTPRAAPPFEV